MSLANDRMKKAQIILPKGSSRSGLNMHRVDISNYDTPNGENMPPKHKVYMGERGGIYVIIDGEKRYLRG